MSRERSTTTLAASVVRKDTILLLIIIIMLTVFCKGTRDSPDRERSSVPALVCGWTTKRFLHAQRDK
jgi:hypothetical protein